MCIAIPSLVVEMLDGERALVEVGGTRREVSLQLVDGIRPGDYVTVHLGRALHKLDPFEAVQTLALFDDIVAAHAAGAA